MKKNGWDCPWDCLCPEVWGTLCILSSMRVHRGSDSYVACLSICLSGHSCENPTNEANRRRRPHALCTQPSPQHGPLQGIPTSLVVRRRLAGTAPHAARRRAAHGTVPSPGLCVASALAFQRSGLGDDGPASAQASVNAEPTLASTSAQRSWCTNVVYVHTSRVGAGVGGSTLTCNVLLAPAPP